MHFPVGSSRHSLPMLLRACCLLFTSFALFSQSAAAANQPPTISGKAATYVYVGSKFSFKPTARDPEGKALRFSIANKPGWASFSTSTGLLSGTPRSVGLWNGIKIQVSDGVSSVALPAFSLRAVSRSNVAPTLSGSPVKIANVGIAYSFQPIAKDSNGDPLLFKIANKPSWASFDSWTGRLSGTPSSSHVGTYSSISISATDGGKTATLPSFSITVASASSTNRAPTISGTPPTSARVAQAYSFRPTASDADGDTLGFSISNKPSWASFATSTGTLSGTPSATGSHGNIIISVSDGKITKSLPAFTLTVSAAATPTNPAPVISGAAPTSVVSGTAYSFRPTASDANGNTLTFSIANAPVWASFNTSTGLLSGTPSSAQVGVYSSIVISVTDGTTKVSLPAFSINVTQAQPRTAVLSWTAPTTNTDGTTLTNLAGYRIHYGVSASVLSQTIQVANAGITTYVVEDLAPGTYYFAVKAYTTSGAESASSNVASKSVQ